MYQDLVNKIKELKKKKKAIILAHNYQLGEVQDIADFVGDSLGLSQEAAKTDAEIIVFCGVHFMAETAVILCPEKTVLMPDPEAGCPMADMIDAEKIIALKKEHHDAVVVCYVNTTAEVKAESDICCTSANAVKVVESIPRNREIIFVPDKYLGQYVAKRIGREFILWRGFCPTHVKILAEDINQCKKEHPKAEVIVHPECTPEVIAVADKVLGTTGICKAARESKAREFIIGTEIGILHRLRKENPDKRFYAASDRAICPNMKKTTIEKVLWSLEDMKEEIKVPEDVRVRALKAVERMMEVV